MGLSPPVLKPASNARGVKSPDARGLANASLRDATRTLIQNLITNYELRITNYLTPAYMNPEYFMRLALAEAKEGDAPYGAVIVKDHEVVALAHNTVKRDNDPSAHAEINVIRSLTAKLQRPSLEGYSIYTTGEPCPMCATACIWSGLSEIVYGASIQDLITINQSQISISCEEIIAKSFRNIKVIKDVLKSECLELFKL